MSHHAILVVAGQKLVCLGQNGINAHGRGVQASHHVLCVGNDLADIPCILTKFLNDVGILRQSIGKYLRVIDRIRERPAGVFHKTFQLSEHSVGSRGNILGGSEKIVDRRRIGVDAGNGLTLFGFR